MAASIQVGTTFIQNRPLILRTMGLESEPYEGTWDVLQFLPSANVDQWIRGDGWNYFFMAAEVRGSAFGRLMAKSIRRALKQIFIKVRNADFNCLEVTEITEKRFLGVLYITVCAHSRHIQQGPMMEFAQKAASPTPVFVNTN